VIHAFNAPWAFETLDPDILSPIGDQRSALAGSRNANSPDFHVAGKVPRSDDDPKWGRVSLIAFDYLVVHEPDEHPLSGHVVCERRVAKLVASNPEDGGDSQKETRQWCLCSHRICAVFSHGKQVRDSLHYERTGPPCTVAIFEESDCVDSVLPDHETFLEQAARRDDCTQTPSSLSVPFIERFTAFVQDHLREQWDKVMDVVDLCVRSLENKAYTQAQLDEGHLGDRLWECSRAWLVLTRVLTANIEMLDAVEKEVCDFGYRLPRREGHAPEQDIWQGDTLRYYINTRDHLKGLLSRVKQDYSVSTMNMLDMLYKRVAIRDARHSLQLNSSLWRLSWITFIFLPLTFVAGLFGMNVDVVSQNPSFKWYFVIACPLMCAVFLGLFLIKRSGLRSRSIKTAEHMA